MSGSRYSSSYEALVACKNTTLNKTLIKKSSNEMAIISTPTGDSLDVLFTRFGSNESLALLVSERTDLNKYFSLYRRFYEAKRFNNMAIAKIILDSKKIDYKLEDEKTPASLHKAAYFGDKTTLGVLKKLAADTNPKVREDLINRFNKKDEFGERPLDCAIQGGDTDFAMLALEFTSEINIDTTPITMLESRNTHLAPLFMDKLAKQYFGGEEELVKYISEILQTAAKYSDNPSAAIIDLIEGFSDRSIKNKWIRILSELALTLDLADIFKSLTSKYTYRDALQAKAIAGAFYTVTNFASDVLDTKRLVIETYLPFIEKNPTSLNLVIAELLEKDDEADFDDNIATVAELLSYVSVKAKKEAARSTKSKLIQDMLHEPRSTPALKSNNINHRLFELSKAGASLAQFRPLIEQYKEYFKLSTASAIDYNYAANLAFLLQDYKLAKEWYENAENYFRGLKKDKLESATLTLTRQLLVIFDKLTLTPTAEFTEVVKNNLLRIVDSNAASFSLPFTALLFLKKPENKHGIFKELYDAICEAKPSLPIPDNKSHTSLQQLYILRQAVISIDEIMQESITQYNPTEVIVKPNKNSIDNAKNKLAIYQISINLLEFADDLAKSLNSETAFSVETKHLDQKTCKLSNEIDAAVEKLKISEAEKAKRIEEDKKKAKLNAAAKSLQAKEKKHAQETRKLSAEQARIKAEEDRIAEEARAKAEAKQKAEEARTKAEAERKAEATRIRAEAKRKTEEARAKAEAERKAEEARLKAEAERKAEEARAKAEAQRKAEEARTKAEAERKADEARLKAEAERKAEEARIRAEADRKTEQTRLVELAQQAAQDQKAKESASKLTEMNGPAPSSARLAAEEAAARIAKSKNAPGKGVFKHKNVKPISPSISTSQTSYSHKNGTEKRLMRQNSLPNIARPNAVLVPVIPVPVVFFVPTTLPTPHYVAVPTVNSQLHNVPLPQMPLRQPLELPAENPIYYLAQQLGYPRSVAILSIKFEGRISIKGGAPRDLALGRKPKDYDFYLFGNLSEVEHSFAKSIVKKNASSATLLLDGNKHDIAIAPAGTHRQNSEMVASDSASSDLTINSMHHRLTRRGVEISDTQNGMKHLKKRKMQVPNKKDAIGTYVDVYPVRLFRLEYLNEDLNFRCSKKITALINETKAHRKTFINKCARHKNKISTTIDKMIASYGYARTYKLLADKEHDTVLIESGVRSKEEVSFYKNAFINEFVQLMFGLKNLNGALFKVAHLIWENLSNPNSQSSNSQRALLCVSKNMSQFGVFAARYEDEQIAMVDYDAKYASNLDHNKK